MAGYELARAAFPEVRQSLLANFDSCELSSFFDETFGDYHTHPQGRGSVFHRTVARCIRLMVENGEHTIDVDMAYAELEEALRQEGEDERLPVPMDMVAELRITVKKWALENSFRIENIVSVEERYYCTVTYIDPETQEVVDRKLTGALDVLLIDAENEAIVIDWKDTWALPGPSEISEGGFFQQRFYAMLVFINYPSVQRVTLREEYPRYGEAREATIERPSLPELMAEFSALVQRFDAAWTAHIASRAELPVEEDETGITIKQLPIAPGEFAPSPGAHCSYCKMPERCPLLPAVRGAGSVTTREEAETAAAQYMVASAVRKKLGDALRAFTKENGPVPIKDAKRPRMIGYVERESTSRPTPAQFEAAAMVLAQIDEEEQAALAQIDDPYASDDMQAVTDQFNAKRKKLMESVYKKTKGTTFKDYVPKPDKEND